MNVNNYKKAHKLIGEVVDDLRKLKRQQARPSMEDRINKYNKFISLSKKSILCNVGQLALFLFIGFYADFHLAAAIFWLIVLFKIESELKTEMDKNRQ